MGVSYLVKDVGMDLNFKNISLAVADLRWFRWGLWKYTSALLNTKFSVPKDQGAGYAINGGEALDELFNRYKNWTFEQIESGKLPKLDIDYNLMMTGGLEFSSGYLADDRNATIEEFYRILDTVDFQFNEPLKAARRVYDRLVRKEGYSITRYKKIGRAHV